MYFISDTYNSRAEHEQVISPCSRGISSECINRRYWVRSAIAVILQIPRILFRDRRVWKVFDFLDEYIKISHFFGDIKHENRVV